jgi:hypothetical protein
MDERLLAGVDLCADYTQIAYYSMRKAGPIALSRDADDGERLIPTRLALRKAKHEWIIGDDILSAIEEDESDVEEVPDFLKAIVANEEITVDGEKYESSHLLQIYLRRLLNVLRTFDKYVEIGYIVFTSDIAGETFSTILRDALHRIKIEKDRYSFVSHEEAFISYVIHEKRDIWQNDVIKFELDDKGLHSERLTIINNLTPMAAAIERRDFSDITVEMIEADREKAAGSFLTLASLCIDKHDISTIFAVGRGFLTDFADRKLADLSTGRHVFRGQNLYVSGACELALLRSRNEDEKYIYFDEDRVRSGISILTYVDGKEREAVLIHPATLWYEASSELDLIVSDVEELTIQIKDFITKKTERRFISLTGLENDEGNFVRLRVEASFKDRNTCEITVKDMGFGTFVPTTNRIYELTLCKK